MESENIATGTDQKAAGLAVGLDAFVSRCFVCGGEIPENSCCYYDGKKMKTAHMDCIEKVIRVVRIEYGGTPYYDKDIDNALLGLKHAEDGEEYTVSFEEMTAGAYHSLPTFQGF